MNQDITLQNDYLELVVCPYLGGGIKRFDKKVDGTKTAIFRRCETPSGQDVSVLDLGCFITVPFFNRVDGAISIDSVKYELNRSLDIEKCPIHGNAFLQSFIMLEQTESKITMKLVSYDYQPFAYECILSYELVEKHLNMELSVTNLSPLTLPYGLGFHPYFHKTTTSQIGFHAQDMWLCDESVLPTTSIPTATHPKYDYSIAKLVGNEFLDNSFEHWDGVASIYENERLLCNLEASSGLSLCHLFTPVGEDFFCFEAISHLTNEVNSGKGSYLKYLKEGEGVREKLVVSG